MITKIYIGNERLDLFADENFAIKSSIVNSQDITRNTTDFSKDFSVPATDNNNNIFKHYYDANIDNTFDARTKVNGSIELDGLPFKKGKFSLRKVIVKSGRPSSYSIYFTGNATDINSKVKNDYLSVLDLTEYAHSYNSDNVKLGLQSGLFGGDIVYNPLVGKQLFYNSATNEPNNVAYNNASQTNGLIWSDLKPAIRLKSVIDAIKDRYGFTFNGGFFERNEFTKLFLSLSSNRGDIGRTSLMADFNGGSNAFVNFDTNIGSFTAQNTSASGDLRDWYIDFTVFPASGFEATPYTIKYYRNGELITSQPGVGISTLYDYLHYDGGSFTYNVYFEIETNQDFDFTTSLLQTLVASTATTSFLTTGSLQSITSTVNITNNLPKIKVIDFLRGLFKMFKLVVIPQSENVYYINDLNTYYSEGKLIDITKYVNFDNISVSRGNILKEIKYNFEEPQTILNSEFLNINGIAYGDEELELADEDGEPLDGGDLEYQLPFEQVVYERLNDLSDNIQTNFMYGALIDEELSEVNIEPHIFYNVNTLLGNKKVAFIESDGGVYALNSVNTPSHTIDFLNMPFSTIFGSEFSTWNAQLISNTLYTNYHQDYIQSIFNVKRRDFNLKAFLPIDIVTTISLNDVLKIKGNYYRIDDYSLNPISGESELNLINSFDNSLVGFAGSQTSFLTDFRAQQLTLNVPKFEEFQFTKIDKGFGVDWLTVSNNKSLILLDLDINEGLEARNIVVQVFDKPKTQSFYVYITQQRGEITFDNTSILWSNTDITFND